MERMKWGRIEMTVDNRVVLITSTFYKSLDVLRCQLFLRTLEAVKTAGYHMVVVDASPPEVRAEFEKRAVGSNVHIYPELVRGMGPSRRQATFIASELAVVIGAKVLMWLEAEKADMIRFVPELVDAFFSPMDVHQYDIVVPYRTSLSWASYPVFQMDEELKQNRRSTEHTYQDLDVAFGPMLARVGVARRMILGETVRFKEWGISDTYVWQWFVTLAFRLGYAIGSVPVDFIYPPEQKAEEDHPENQDMRAKRARQLETALKAHEFLGNLPTRKALKVAW